ncbi:hypothetical protein C806_03743 [Lachnospiraceae bacterium 3-1]|nr:hypothetical protein C806_03743 [Lachnospiraceae bacterium 3-1]
MLKIGILDRITIPDLEERILNSIGKIICFNATNECELPNEIANLDAVIVYNKITLTQITINKLLNCKVIVKAGVGFDNIDICAAGNIGIPVINVPDYGTNDVADHTFALFLSYVKKIGFYNNALQKNIVQYWKPGNGKKVHRLSELTFGIIGMGRIGTAVAMRAKAFGMNVVYYDPYLPDGYDKTYQVKEFKVLEELVSNSNVISIHVPLNRNTEKMINYSLLQNAKYKPILINTARGKVINTEDIYLSLKENIIEAYLADVFESEPPSDNTELLLQFSLEDGIFRDRIIFTPHSASHTIEARKEMREKAAISVKMFIQENKMKNCINYNILQRNNYYE